jgi:hypothetical protein
MRKKILYMLVLMIFGAFFQSQAQQYRFIHNIARPNLYDSVDIFLNGQQVIEALDYRAASRVITGSAPRDTFIIAKYRPGPSIGVGDTLFYQEIAVVSGLYTIYLTGDGTSNFPYRLISFTDSLNGVPPEKVRVRVFHGTIDAPPIDIWVRDSTGSVSPGVIGLSYGQYSSNLILDAKPTILEIRNSQTQAVVRRFLVPFIRELRGQTFSAFASGYLDTVGVITPNVEFDVFANWLNDPDTIEQSSLLISGTKLACAQFINASAIPSNDSITVFVAGNLIEEDKNRARISRLKFKRGSSFFVFPYNQPAEVAIAPWNAVTSFQAEFRDTITFDSYQPYYIVYTGVTGPGYATNPDGINVNLGLNIIPGVFTETDSNSLGIRLFHAVSDAPAGNVIACTSRLSLASGLKFREATSTYTKFRIIDPLPKPEWYQLIPVSGATDTLSYLFDLGESAAFLNAQTGLILVSGFFDRAANNNDTDSVAISFIQRNGQGFDLMRYQCGVTSIENNLLSKANIKLFPNPAHDKLQIEINTALAGNYNFRLINVQGKEVYQNSIGFLSAGHTLVAVRLPQLPAGIYQYEFRAENQSVFGKVIIE